MAFESAFRGCDPGHMHESGSLAADLLARLQTLDIIDSWNIEGAEFTIAFSDDEM
jgi:hypothetical protein